MSKMATIYELSNLTAEMLSFLDVADDEELDPQAVADTLEGMEGDFDATVGDLCKFIKNLEGEREAVKAEAKRLQARSKRIDGKIEWIKRGMMAAMQAFGKKDAGELLKAHIRGNGGPKPLVYVEGFTPDDAPEPLRKVTYSFDTEAIRKALNDGEDLGFVKYGDRGESITIK